MNERIGPHYQRDKLRFLINRTRIYQFFIHSLDYFVPNYNCLLLPINRVKVFPETDCTRFVTISLTEKHELNTAEDPCEAIKEYNFTLCIKESIASEAGCDGKQNCGTGEQYRSDLQKANSLFIYLFI